YFAHSSADMYCPIRRPRSFAKNNLKKELLKYCVFITYTHTPNIGKVNEHVLKEWEGAPWPLLLILIDFEEAKEFASHREFKNMLCRGLWGD
ncbi:unnamed protein product, partial [marine sediment metagenome]